MYAFRCTTCRKFFWSTAAQSPCPDCDSTAEPQNRLAHHFMSVVVILGGLSIVACVATSYVGAVWLLPSPYHFLFIVPVSIVVYIVNRNEPAAAAYIIIANLVVIAALKPFLDALIPYISR